MKNNSLLSKSINLFLIPTTAWRTQPVPFPPVIERLFTESISKFCGSTMTSFTLPDKTGSARAGFPDTFSISKLGGLITS